MKSIAMNRGGKAAGGAVILLLMLDWAASAATPVTPQSPPAPADKSGFTLFHPTPALLLRDLVTDRPDKTESPYTVDAGHFQIEADVVSYSYDRHNLDRSDTGVETVAIAPVNLKVGLLNQVDFQLVLQTYTSVRARDRASGLVRKNRGFGDVITRVKVNLWGDDGGRTAFGVMPYAKWPANQDHLGNNSVEGGVILPLALDLPHGWGVGLMTQYDFNRNSSGGDYHAEFINSITFGRVLIGQLAGFMEFFSSVSSERGSTWVGTVDVGFTYALTKDIQVDAGINIGVTRSADDWNPFLGISWRF